jgi:hypothetical protein
MPGPRTLHPSPPRRTRRRGARPRFKVFDFKRVMTAIVNFVNVELSAVLFRHPQGRTLLRPVPSSRRKPGTLKTSVYGNRRRAVRTVMAAVMERLLCWLAPGHAVHDRRSLWRKPPERLGAFRPLAALSGNPPPPGRDAALAARWEKIFKVRRVVHRRPRSRTPREAYRRLARSGAEGGDRGTPRSWQRLKARDAGDVFHHVRGRTGSGGRRASGAPLRSTIRPASGSYRRRLRG